MFNKGKYVKSRFKNKGSPCYFLSSRGQKIKNITSIELERLFLFIFLVSFFMAFQAIVFNTYFVPASKIHRNIGSRCLVHEFSFTDIFNDINHGYRAAILKKDYLWLLPFYMCGYLFVLWKGAHNDAHCNCIKPP